MGKNTLKIYGLIGYPVKHSLSPAMHNAAFRVSGINAEYRLFEVKPEELRDFLNNPGIEFKDKDARLVRAGDIEGFNITIPHKVKAKEILIPNDLNELRDKPTELIKSVLWYRALSGAINTIRRDIKGYYNTDAPGFMRSLEGDLKFEVKNKNVLLFGCGGAGRAVIAAISHIQSGAKKIYIYDSNSSVRDLAKIHFSQFAQLEEKLEFITFGEIREIVRNCQLLVNASPVGMKEGDPSVIDKNLLHKSLSVYDVVYNRQTQLIKDAQERKILWAGGLGMLLYQGVAAWELWTERQADDNIIRAMREALKQEIGRSV